MQQPKFIPVYFQNLTVYDSYFLITQLGFDTQTISVIPHAFFFLNMCQTRFKSI
jgi:hypothetical protein